MPEIRFQIELPDGSQEVCYSPSLVVRQYFEEGSEYPLTDFVERSRTALNIASDRVKAKYGFSCSLAIGQLRQIETMAIKYAELPDPKVRLIKFIEN
ncbi:MSMEG_0570 family nitrogen starvation response protein [Cyanobacteria bacterium FACHB-471]|nr:MSMEG_0570 family nitrogen starvation response protein [Cyanobacteria bacterium FACHB-471]